MTHIHALSKLYIENQIGIPNDSVDIAQELLKCIDEQSTAQALSLIQDKNAIEKFYLLAQTRNIDSSQSISW